MGEVFSQTGSDDPQELANYTFDQINQLRPPSILCHGMGVPLTLLSLWKLRKKEGPGYQPKVTIFNGAFRGVSLLKAREPFWIQFLSAKRLARHAERAGGKVDASLVHEMARIRALYRAVILHRATEKMASLLGMAHLARIPQGERYRLDVQIIASPNDPFLPLQSMKDLARDLKSQNYIEIEYGHFPYSGSQEILKTVEAFENRPLN
jgi:pimeloyl-ACP methyl ester carboxylesterase